MKKSAFSALPPDIDRVLAPARCHRLCDDDGSMVSESFERLRARGIPLSLDDYGTGYASLGYLHRFPFTTLKIDKSFVDGVPDNEEALVILKSVVVLARGLGLKTVAEGIEHTEQRDALAELGCDIGQGFLFSPPVENAAMRKMLGKKKGAKAG